MASVGFIPSGSLIGSACMLRETELLEFEDAFLLPVEDDAPVFLLPEAVDKPVFRLPDAVVFFAEAAGFFEPADVFFFVVLDVAKRILPFLKSARHFRPFRGFTSVLQ
ncbi:MAG: hypothetical protein LIO99_04030 [Clostridiales bacterium]|nr:hypothetical protein [Clostridiales bacterium]